MVRDMDSHNGTDTDLIKGEESRSVATGNAIASYDGRLDASAALIPKGFDDMRNPCVH